MFILIFEKWTIDGFVVVENNGVIVIVRPLWRIQPLFILKLYFLLLFFHSLYPFVFHLFGLGCKQLSFKPNILFAQFHSQKPITILLIEINIRAIVLFCLQPNMKLTSRPNLLRVYQFFGQFWLELKQVHIFQFISLLSFSKMIVLLVDLTWIFFIELILVVIGEIGLNTDP